MAATSELLAQHAALTQSVGIAPLARTLLAVTGGDRVTFLHSFTTNDVKRLAVGGGCEAFVTSPQGKTLGHGYLFCEADRILIDAAAGQAEALLAHFSRYVITEDIEFADLSGEFCDVLVAGPKAAEVLKKVTGAKAPVADLAHAVAAVGGQQVVVRRVSFTGPECYFVQTRRSEQRAVMDVLAEHGARICGESAVDAARLEAGTPLFGRDIDDENLPQEVGRDAAAISFTKGCYLGQETVARIDAVGHVNRLLVRLKFASDVVPHGGAPLLAGEQRVGHVTSAAWSPRYGVVMGLGYVRRAHAKAGSKLSSAAGTVEVVS